MFRKPVKITEIEIEGQRYAARYYEQKTARGSRRFSCEVTIDATDRIIVDDGKTVTACHHCRVFRTDSPPLPL